MAEGTGQVPQFNLTLLANDIACIRHDAIFQYSDTSSVVPLRIEYILWSGDSSVVKSGGFEYYSPAWIQSFSVFNFDESKIISGSRCLSFSR
jgi:hypothetical protein